MANSPVRWFSLNHGDPIIVGCSKTPVRFRRDPIPGVHTSCDYSHRYRRFHIIGYLRAKADRETGCYVRIGRMEEFHGVQDENERRTDKSWKSHSKKKHQWK